MVVVTFPARGRESLSVDAHCVRDPAVLRSWLGPQFCGQAAEDLQQLPGDTTGSASHSRVAGVGGLTFH